MNWTSNEYQNLVAAPVRPRIAAGSANRARPPLSSVTPAPRPRDAVSLDLLMFQKTQAQPVLTAPSRRAIATPIPALSAVYRRSSKTTEEVQGDEPLFAETSFIAQFQANAARNAPPTPSSLMTGQLASVEDSSEEISAASGLSDVVVSEMTTDPLLSDTSGFCEAEWF